MVDTGTPDASLTRSMSAYLNAFNMRLMSEPDGMSATEKRRLDDFIAGSLPSSDDACQPKPGDESSYRDDVPDPRQTLWTNVEALMVKHWGETNNRRLANEAGIGETTLYRLKKGETSLTLKVIESLGRVLNRRPWQLLKPGLVVAEEPLSDLAVAVGAMFDALPPEKQGRAYALITQILEFDAAPPLHAHGEPPTPAPLPSPSVPPATAPAAPAPRRKRAKAPPSR